MKHSLASVVSSVSVFIALSFVGPSLGAASFAAAANETPTFDPAWMNALEWRCIGPANMSGRITALAVYADDPSTYYAATASGGLLKTTNGGITYQHQFDREATVSIGHVAVAQSDPDIVWVGTGEANPRNSVSYGDGVYKSTDGGRTWQNMGLRDSYQIGQIVIRPDNPDIVYVGALGRLWGTNDQRGLFRTMDGGETWEHILFIDERTGVIDVDMHPEDPYTLIVATYERQRDGFDVNDPAKRWGPGGGLYKTTDGGENWTRLTNGLPTVNYGRVGVDYCRGNPDIVYAIIETERIGRIAAGTAFMGMNAEDAEIGARLTEVTRNGPAARAGLRNGDILLAIGDTHIASNAHLTRLLRNHRAEDVVSVLYVRNREFHRAELTFGRRADDNRLREFDGELGGQRANIQDDQGYEGFESGGIFRSDDGGDTWSRINSLNPRPMYFSKIRVDPSNANLVYVLGVALYRSSDGGRTFRNDGARGGVHVDHHDLWIDPGDGRRMILGNDGGIYITHDRMSRWDHHNHFANGQFYHVAVDPRPFYNVYGGLQDNGTWGGPSRVRTAGGPINADWIRIGGGDGFVCAVDPEDPDQIYYESQNGGMARVNLRTGERVSLRPRAPRGMTYRFNWRTPFILSHHNSRIYYVAGNYVFRSLHKGDNPEVISPEISLTRRGTATALAESPRNPNVLYVGTDDGALWRTTDGGKTWDDLFAAGSGDLAANSPTADDPAVAAGMVGGADPVSGEWLCSMAIGEGRFEFALNLSLEASNLVSGTFSSRMSDAELTGGRFDSETGVLRVELSTRLGDAVLAATVADDSLTGTIEGAGGQFATEVTGQRHTADAGVGEPLSPGEDEPAAAANQDPQPPSSDSADSVDRGLDTPIDDGTPRPISQLVPKRMWISGLEASRHVEGRVYLSIDGHRSDNDEAWLFVSEDFGDTWTSLRANLPVVPVRTIREDIVNRNVLYIGTEFGAWVSVDRGESWTSFNDGNFPTVAVHEIAQHPTMGEIVAATHGRSLWILDVSGLRQLTSARLNAAAFLCRPQTVYVSRRDPARGGTLREFAGQNAPSGTSIYYTLGEDAQSISLTVQSVEGDTIRELTAPATAGFHRVAWDLRRVSGRQADGRPRMLPVRPGEYLIVLEVDGRRFTEVLEIRRDPDLAPETLLALEEELLEAAAAEAAEAEAVQTLVDIELR